MHLPKDRNDRVMLEPWPALWAWPCRGPEQRHHQRACGRGSLQRRPAPKFPAQPARGPVPHAHTMTKIVKTDGPVSIVRDPTDLPPPVGKRGPQRVKVDLETVEITGKLADGATYRYWTFNQKVPGPVRPRARRRHGRGPAEEP